MFQTTARTRRPLPSRGPGLVMPAAALAGSSLLLVVALAATFTIGVSGASGVPAFLQLVAAAVVVPFATYWVVKSANQVADAASTKTS